MLGKILSCASALLLSIQTTTLAQLLVGTKVGSDPGRVLSINPATPAVNGIFGDATGFDPTPGMMVKDSQQRIYILNTNPDRIQRYDAAGHFLDNFATSGFAVNGLCFGMAIDSLNNIYVGSHGPLTVDPSDDAIVRFNSSGTPLGTFGQASNAASGFMAGNPLVFDSQGNLYAAMGLGTDRSIVRYAPDGTFLGVFGQATTAASGLSFVSAMAFNSQNHLLVHMESKIIEFDSAGNFLGTFANLSSDGGMAFDTAGHLFATERLNDRVREFNSSGGLIATLTDPGLIGPANLLLIPEPGTVAMLTFGMTLLFARARSRKR
jgi:sugar lactone lactonase YvrE